MKRIWFTISFLAIMVGICVGEQIYLNNFYTHLDRLITAAQKDPNEESIDNIQQYWEKNNDILFVIFEHNNLDNLAVEIRALNPKDDSVKSALKTVQAHNIVFYQNMKASLTNIF